MCSSCRVALVGLCTSTHLACLWSATAVALCVCPAASKCRRSATQENPGWCPLGNERPDCLTYGLHEAQRPTELFLRGAVGWRPHLLVGSRRRRQARRPSLNENELCRRPVQSTVNSYEDGMASYALGSCPSYIDRREGRTK